MELLEACLRFLWHLRYKLHSSSVEVDATYYMTVYSLLESFVSVYEGFFSPFKHLFDIEPKSPDSWRLAALACGGLLHGLL